VGEKAPARPRRADSPLKGVRQGIAQGSFQRAWINKEQLRIRRGWMKNQDKWKKSNDVFGTMATASFLSFLLVVLFIFPHPRHP
jgi:hypothetical protein